MSIEPHPRQGEKVREDLIAIAAPPLCRLCSPDHKRARAGALELQEPGCRP